MGLNSIRNGCTTKYGLHTISGTQPEVFPTTSEKPTWKDYLENWLCGISKSNEEEDRKAKQKENMISSLEQNQTARVVLTSGLVLLLVIGVVLYCFWSLWGYWVVLPSDQVEEWKMDMITRWRPSFLNRTG